MSAAYMIDARRTRIGRVKDALAPVRPDDATVVEIHEAHEAHEAFATPVSWHLTTVGEEP